MGTPQEVLEEVRWVVQRCLDSWIVDVVVLVVEGEGVTKAGGYVLGESR